MCVVAMAWGAHPQWRLVVAGNRDEFHARASAPLCRWDADPAVVAGRDLVSGGGWMGVTDAGRFAVVTNIRDSAGPDTTKLSRGRLVSDWLMHDLVPEHLDDFNPFNLVVTDLKSAKLLSNRPVASTRLLPKGIHGLSNTVADEHWPRRDRLVAVMSSWMERSDALEMLLPLLRDETSRDGGGYPLLIRSPVYGTRCSTVVAVDAQGDGQIIERCYDPDGQVSGERSFNFVWPTLQADAEHGGPVMR